MKKTTFSVFCLAALCNSSSAQVRNYNAEVSMAVLNAMPVQVNPAFTGMFQGGLRAAVAMERLSFSDGSLRSLSLRTSVDMPVRTFKNGSYLAAGLQYTQIDNDNFYGILPNKNKEPFMETVSDISLAGSYHHQLSGEWLHGLFRNAEVAVGAQVGFANKDYVYYQLRGMPFQDGSYGVSRRPLIPFHAGVSFSKATKLHFSYTLGVSVQNAHQSAKESRDYGNFKYGDYRNMVFSAGANWQPIKRLVLKPAAYYSTSFVGTQVVVGSEVHLRVTDTGNKNNLSMFAGAWKVMDDQYDWHDIHDMEVSYQLSAGVELNNYRIAVSANEDRYFRGGYQIAFRYQPQFQLCKHKRAVPCDRF